MLTTAQTKWPGLYFEKHSSDEYTSACPFCGQGTDRFHIWIDTGNFWCRQCDAKGWIDDEQQLDPQELRLRRIEAEQKRIQRQQAEHERRLSALERMARCKDHLAYYRNLTPEAMQYWLEEGISQDNIDRYQLGYCSYCPTDKDHRASYTIPVINGGHLRNIRHRLISGDNGDKYRPHMAGLPTTLFNADSIQTSTGSVVIVEGEKKSIVTQQLGFANVGLMGKAGFQQRWVKHFDKFKRVIVVLDPDAHEQAVSIAGLFGGRGYVATLPDKIDDLVVKYGATAEDLRWFFELGRKV